MVITQSITSAVDSRTITSKPNSFGEKKLIDISTNPQPQSQPQGLKCDLYGEYVAIYTVGVCAKAMWIDGYKYKNDIVLSFLFKFKLISQYVLTYLVLALYFLFLFYFSRLCVYKSEHIHLSWRMNGNKKNQPSPST